MKELDASLKAAIDDYFVKKYHDGTGAFKDGEKYPAVEQIKGHCARLRLYCEIYPGLVCISLGKEGALWFDRHNQKTGTFISADEKNCWRKMDEGRKVKSYEYLADQLDKFNEERGR